VRSWTLLSAALVFALAACGQSASTNADAQTKGAASAQAAPEAAARSSEALSNADKAAILQANHLTANAQGLVRNECSDMVTPQFIPADVGLGNTVLFVMVGGPNGGYTCYGDGPDLHLMKRDGAGWRQIYGNRGGAMVILPTTHNGAHDLAFGGPGMSHALYRWNGSDYEQAGEVFDDAIGNAIILPNT